MMGRSHADQAICASGIATTALILGGFEPFQNPVIPVICAIILVSGSQTPDMDSHGATATQVYGPATKAASWIIRLVSRTVYSLTRGAKDPENKGSHRTLTHTLLGNLVAGGLLAGVTSLSPVAAGVSLGVLAGIGLFPFLSKKRLYFFLAIGIGYLAYRIGAEAYWWIWGVAFFMGNAVHCFGDSCTLSGTPYWWPLNRNGKRWGNKHILPDFARFRTGSLNEKAMMGVTYAVTAASIGSMILLHFA
jgi:membrane-bound metal-dependent hydrolase YbcI (DUF457 family)